MTILVRAAILTVLLGATVVVSWTVVGGLSAWRGGFELILRDRGFLLYGLLTSSAALVLFVLVRTRWRDESIIRLAAIVGLAWIGEGLCVALIGPSLADEVDGPFAWYMWLVATGFGLQPAAAMLGALVARRSAVTRDAAGP